MFQLGLQTVSLDNVRPNAVALRQVDTKNERYNALRDSIRDDGFNGAITGRIMTDVVSGIPYIEIIDGLHRYTAAKEVNLSDIKVDVIEADQRKVLKYQFIANSARIETKPAEFAKQIKRLMDLDPTVTVSSLAAELKISKQLLEQRLSINGIESDKIKELIDDGKIKLGNAYALAKLTKEEQEQYADAAITEEPAKFLADVNAIVKARKEAERRGEKAAPITYTPTPHQRKFAEIKQELGLEGDSAKKSAAIKKYVTPDMTPFEAAELMLKWVLSLDADSVAEAKKAFESKQEKQKADKERKEKEALTSTKQKADRALEKSQLESELVNLTIEGKITNEERDTRRKALKDKWAAEDAAHKAAGTTPE